MLVSAVGLFLAIRWIGEQIGSTDSVLTVEASASSEKMATLPRVLAALVAIIVAGRLLGAVIQRLGQPRVIGEVIAIGIFLTPATMARSLGSPLWLLMVWLTMGLMALCGALCYGALAARYPEAGGGYVYLREAFGPLVSFLYGWKCLLVMDPGITALLGMGLAGYVGYAFGWSGPILKAVAIGTIVGLVYLVRS